MKTKEHTIRKAIEECNRYIAKESVYSDEFRNQEKLDWYINHRSFLETKLAEI